MDLLLLGWQLYVRDGFVSMHTDTEGVLVTEKIKFDGNHFFVNCTSKGFAGGDNG